MTEQASMRFDLQIISSWIQDGSTVLDLGCGKGDLLAFLRENKAVKGVGIEQDEEKVACAISKGLTVLQGDLSTEVRDYPENRFDYVVLSQTLQQVYEPAELLQELIRIGRRVIVSFPNFSHWGVRLQVLFTGRAPKNEHLPYDWYDTPNIRVITMKDFRLFMKKIGVCILKETAINTHHHDIHGHIVRFLPNWRATYGIFLVASCPGGKCAPF